MNRPLAEAWLPSFLVPFVSLSYPTATPSEPDSFSNSTYYNDGLLDICFVITCIASFAILRDITRLWLAEPFARWKLTRDFRKSKTRKNSVNGKGGLDTPPSGEKTPLLRPNITRAEERILNHKVQRFAEQSWSVVYYTVQWGFGLVSILFNDTSTD
jgi:very-long-chain ceramide synthase